MHRTQMIIAVLIAVVLGGTLSLALFQQMPAKSQAVVENSQDETRQPAAGTAQPTRSAEPTLSQVTGSAPVENSFSPVDVPPGVPPGVSEGAPQGEDLEDVLLLVDSSVQNNFERSFCGLVQFYGLLCRQVAVNQADIAKKPDLLQDAAGKPFKLIVVRAGVFFSPRLMSESSRQAILQAVTNQGSNLLVTDLDQWILPSGLKTLSNNQVLGASRPEDQTRDWQVSNDFPEITREFTGQAVLPSPKTAQNDNALLLAAPNNLNVLLSSTDDQGKTYPIFAFQEAGQAGGKIFYSAADKWSAGENAVYDIVFYRAYSFSQVAPVLFTLRYVMGDEAWHRETNFANLTVDGVALQEPYRYLDYFKIQREMEREPFFTTLALLPDDSQNWQSQVVSLVLAHPGQFSLAQYGYSDAWAVVGGAFQYSSNNNADESLQMGISEGISRMEMLRADTGLAFERVMIFPSRIPSSQALEILRGQNFLATINDQVLPADAQPSDNPFEGLSPANLNYAGLPILDRRIPVVTNTRPDMVPVMFDLFFDRPALLYTNPSRGGLLGQGMKTLLPLIQAANTITGKPEWLSLGEVVRHLYLEKVNDDGSIDVRMYTNELVYQNSSGADQVFHFSKTEPLSSQSLNVTVNGQAVEARWEENVLRLDLSIPSGASIELRVGPAGQR